MDQRPKNGGRIITFYSYKGGTGRSMALANVAWLLAMGGKRVLTIDWDLEAPGLHRYFEPFIADKNLAQSSGVIDFVIEFASAAVSHEPDDQSKDWFLPYTNLLAHAISLDWNFPDQGIIDFVPAGRQDAAYPTRVNSFDWSQFYERLGGGVLLQTVKERLRERYDYVLIDSRTGVSDTAGVSTIQMPDDLVVCFTLNRQSTLGASMAALAASNQRRGPSGEAILKIWPVPMRVETSEKERVDLARALARTRFSSFLRHLSPEEENRYWEQIEVPYFPYYAFDEVLAVFADSPGTTKVSSSLLASMEGLTQHICGDDYIGVLQADISTRETGLNLFRQRSAWERTEELSLLSNEYENIRVNMQAGPQRTSLMNALVSRAQLIAGKKEVGAVAELFFQKGTNGARIVGLALARVEPQRAHVEMALEGVSHSRSAFEQFHALFLVQGLLPMLDPTAAEKILAATQDQMGKTITSGDMSRFRLATNLVESQKPRTFRESTARMAPHRDESICGWPYTLIEYSISASFIRYEDPIETHGPFVVTRGGHKLELPSFFRIGKNLVTNELFLQFSMSGGYVNDAFWDIPLTSRAQFLTQDGKTFGPSTWPGGNTFPNGMELHPVSGISYVEAEAFVRWCNVTSPVPDYVWSLPPEDVWEIAARTESGLVYPWGDAFDSNKCNSIESGLNTTTPVDAYPEGASRIGCQDMAGNVWEFVKANDKREPFCVLRGGSFKNNRFEMRSYLRLIWVPNTHRPEDFGFRLVQKPPDFGDVNPKARQSAKRAYK